MSIPTNYIDKITKDGDSRYICPGADKVRVDNENFDSDNLDGVLGEVAEAIEDAASGGYAPPEGGIPATDLTQAVQDILNDVANKVDKVTGKGLSTEDFTAALKAKLEALDPYTKAQVDAAIQHAVDGLGSGSVDSVTINGVNHEPINGIVDLGTVVGQQGPKGEQGDTLLVDDDFDPVTMIVNDLDTSDGTVALSARQGKIIKQAIERVQANLQTVLDALANMAFTGNRPTLTAIDWTGGTFYATINKTLSGCTATDNTTNGQIAEGSTLTMTLTADSGFTLTGAIISVTNSRGQNISYTLANNVLTISNVVGTINISVAAKAIHQISLGSGSSNVAFASGTATEAVDGSSWTGAIEAASGYTLPASIVVTMGGNTISPTYSQSTGEITIASVTGAVVITAVAVEAGKVNVSYNLRNMVVSSDNTTNGQITEGGTLTVTLATAPMTTPQIPSGSPSTLPLYGSYNGVTYNGEWSTPHVVVKKGGIEVQGAYNASTGVVTVANVDDEIEITAICEPKHYFSASIGGNSVSPHYPSSPGYNTSLANALGISSIYLKLPNTCTKVRWNHMAKNYNDTAWGSNMFLFTYKYTTNGNVWSQNIKEYTVAKSNNRYAVNYQDESFTQPTNKSNYMYALARMFTPLLSQCFLVDITDVDADALAALDAAAVAAYNTANGTSYTTADAVAGASLDDIVAIGGRIIFDGRYSEFMTDPNAE